MMLTLIELYYFLLFAILAFTVGQTEGLGTKLADRHSSFECLQYDSTP